jgi:TatD DNase family protein
MSRCFIDAHNHLQDPRLDDSRASVMAELQTKGVSQAMVNGTGCEDWPHVAKLGAEHPWLQLSFGVHPWKVQSQPSDWLERLEELLKRFPQAGLGEVGLDRWIQGADVELQQSMLKAQLALAKRLDRPVTLHCLQAWGLLEEALKEARLSPGRVLIHSYGGPREMLLSFLKLGALVSVSPYFLHERKRAQWETFREVPVNRLLIETDAPDMMPPAHRDAYSLMGPDGQRIHHPANLIGLYSAVAELRGMPLGELQEQVAANYTSWLSLPSS